MEYNNILSTKAKNDSEEIITLKEINKNCQYQD